MRFSKLIIGYSLKCRELVLESVESFSKLANKDLPRVPEGGGRTKMQKDSREPDQPQNDDLELRVLRKDFFACRFASSKS